MKINTWILLIMLVGLICGLKVLKKEIIGKDYEIGTIYDIYFPEDNIIFFRSDDDLFGLINSKTGELQQLFQLEEGEKIIQDFYGHKIIIAKGKKIYVFDHQNVLIKQFDIFNEKLQKLGEFSEIFSLCFWNNSMLILTDKFIMVQNNSLAITGVQNPTSRLELNLQPNEKIHSLLSYFDPRINSPDTLFVTLETSQILADKICFKKLFRTQEKTCIEALQDKILKDILYNGGRIVIEYSDVIEIYDLDYKKLHTFEQKSVQYANNIIMLKKKQQTITEAGQVLQERYIQTSIPVPFRLTFLVSDDKMIFKKNDQILVQIPKKKDDDPSKLWGIINKEERTFEVDFLIQENNNNKLIMYTVDMAKKTYEKKWQLTTIPAVKESQGKVTQDDLQIKKKQAQKNLTKQEIDINEQKANKKNP